MTDLKTKKIILHIGLPKSGTSSIQSFFNQYRGDDLYYASFNNKNHSAAVNSLFCSHKSISSVPINRSLTNHRAFKCLTAPVTHFIKILLDDLSNSRAKSLLVSAERISTLSDLDKEYLLKTFLDRSVPLKVIGYVREPFELASSMLQQRIKSGLSYPAILRPNYRSRLSTFVKLLPSEDLIIKDFDSAIFESGDIVNDFCKILKLQSDAVNSIRVNDSLSESATKLIYRFNRLVNQSDRIKIPISKFRNIISRCYPISEQNGKLDQNEVAKILYVEEDEVEFLFDNFGIKYKSYNNYINIKEVSDYLDDLSGIDPMPLYKTFAERGYEKPFKQEFDTMIQSLLKSICIEP